MGHGTDNATVYKTLLFTLYIPGALCIHTYPQVELEAVSNSATTALHNAAYSGHDTIVGQLLQDKANPTAVTKDWQTALQIAERYGKQDVVQRLRQVHSP